jgi:DNA-binding LacI/PurR family transcriptional regulator
MPVTLKDIAERAGVTSATVSMVINNKPNISAATRKNVLKIAQELNYYPNAIARGLATRKANAIGVIVPNLASSFVVRVLQGIKSTNRDIDYTVLLFDTIGQKETEAQLFQRLARERRIDGAILITAGVTDEELRVFKDESVPCIVVARMCDFLDSVFVNNSRGSDEAVEYLISKGHTRIACVICRKHSLPTDERIAGYHAALRRNGIAADPELMIEVPDDGIYEGKKAFETLINMQPRPTAVFVPAGDMVAIGIIKEAKLTGISMPNNLAVVGFDDIPAAEVIEPALTTVRQPKLEMGDHAINILIDKVEGRETAIKHKELPTKLIIRESA